jgi:hypothetical protein
MTEDQVASHPRWAGSWSYIGNHRPYAVCIIRRKKKEDVNNSEDDPKV